MDFLTSIDSLGKEVQLSFILDFDKKAAEDVIKRSLSAFLGFPVLNAYHPLGTKNISTNFQLERRRDRAGDAWRVSTPFMDWYEARNVFSKISKWIKENAETNDSCNLLISIRFANNSSYQLSNANLLKFILDLREEEIFSKFPSKKNSLYSKPIKKSLLLQMTKSGSSLLPRFNLDLSKTSGSYYAMEFGGPFHNFMVIRYFGGAGYENKKDTILDTLNEILDAFLKSIKDPYLSFENKEELKKIEEKFESIKRSFRNYQDFKKEFPDIKLMVDLSTHESYLSTFFMQIRSKLMEIITEGNLNKGLINYDSDKGRFQLKGMKITDAMFIKHMDIVDCEIEGAVEECDIFESIIKSSELKRCNLFNETVAENSYLFDCYVNSSSELKNCHFAGYRGVMNGEMIAGVFESGMANEKAKISKETKVMQIEKIK